MIALRIADPVITGLIGKWLNAGVMEHGVIARLEAGTPQGGPCTLLTKLRTRCESSRPVFHAHRYVPAMAKACSARRANAARAVPFHALWDQETIVVRRARPPPQRRERQRTFAPRRRRLSWLAQA
jgi:hypothetical protein